MPIESSQSAPRILIVRVGAMGDVLHGLPAVAALRQALPQAQIGWAIEPRWSSLLQAGPNAAARTAAMPLLDRVHPVETRLWSRQPLSLATLRSVLRLRRDLRAQRYDLAIDLQGSIRSAVIAKLSGARLIVGSASPREAAARCFYQRQVALTRPHVIEQAVQIASAAFQALRGANSAELTPLPAALPHDDDAERWAERLLAGETRPVVLLAPTAGWGAKQWPADRYGSIAAELRARGCRVLVNAAGDGDTTAVQVLTAANVESSGALEDISTVASTLPQLTALLRRVSLVIAGDTGPLHLAAALGRPVLALFGPTDPARNGPFATRSEVLRDATSVTNHRRHVATETGLLRISTAMVLDAALRLLQTPHKDRAA